VMLIAHTGAVGTVLAGTVASGVVAAGSYLGFNRAHRAFEDIESKKFTTDEVRPLLDSITCMPQPEIAAMRASITVALEPLQANLSAQAKAALDAVVTEAPEGEDSNRVGKIHALLSRGGRLDLEELGRIVDSAPPEERRDLGTMLEKRLFKNEVYQFGNNDVAALALCRKAQQAE
jgi:hypothetical protein